MPSLVHRYDCGQNTKSAHYRPWTRGVQTCPCKEALSSCSTFEPSKNSRALKAIGQLLTKTHQLHTRCGPRKPLDPAAAAPTPAMPSKLSSTVLPLPLASSEETARPLSLWLVLSLVERLSSSVDSASLSACWLSTELSVSRSSSFFCAASAIGALRSDSRDRDLAAPLLSCFEKLKQVGLYKQIPLLSRPEEKQHLLCVGNIAISVRYHNGGW